MNKFNLVIIESSKKSNAVKKAVELHTGEKAIVIATRGRLFDISLSDNTIDFTDIVLDNIYKPVDKFIHDKIVSASEKCQSVYIMTDNDAEGEVIAVDIQTRLLPNCDPIYRCPLREVTDQAIRSSLESPRAINQILVRDTIAQRLFDLKISSFKTIVPNSLSRIVAPVLDKILTKPLLGRRFSVHHPDNTDVMVYGTTSLNDIDDIKNELKDTTFKGNRKISDDITDQLNTVELVSAISLLTETSAKKSVDIMQDSYERGKISYPRTSSNAVTEEVSLKLRKLAAKKGIFLTSDLKTEESDNHLGIYPTIEPRPEIDLGTLSEPDKTAQLLWNEIFRKDESSNIKEIIHDNFKSDNEFQCKAKISYKDTGSEIEYLKQKEFLTKADFGLSIINLMSDEDIGTPASRNSIAFKIARKYISKTGNLNKLGFQLINDIKENYPSLLDRRNDIKFKELTENSDLKNPIKLANKLLNLYVNSESFIDAAQVETELTEIKDSLNI